MLELPVIPPGSQLHTCAVECVAKCCNHIAVHIDTPRDAQDFDNLRWYVMHEDTHVYKTDGDWYLFVKRRCRHLLPNNVCGNYENRPQVCIDYDPADCEHTGEVQYDLYFEDDAQLDAWLAERKAKRSAAARKAAAKRKRR